MKALIFLLLLLPSILFVGCEKEKEEEILYEVFLSRTRPSFKGNVMGEEVNWVVGNWETGIGSLSGTWWCITEDKKIQQRLFTIYDYEENQETYSVDVKSQAFSQDSSFAHKRSIFEVGRKSIRSSEDGIFEGFDIEVSTINGCFSTSFGNQDSSSLEVLKIDEIPPSEGQPDHKEAKVWLVFSCNLYKPNGEYAGRLEDGMLIGNFLIDHRISEEGFAKNHETMIAQ